ncbi:hypothetical protein ACH5RR_029453, partial [Cinchona calisaya]
WKDLLSSINVLMVMPSSARVYGAWTFQISRRCVSQSVADIDPDFLSPSQLSTNNTIYLDLEKNISPFFIVVKLLHPLLQFMSLLRFSLLCLFRDVYAGKDDKSCIRVRAYPALFQLSEWRLVSHTDDDPAPALLQSFDHSKSQRLQQHSKYWLLLKCPPAPDARYDPIFPVPNHDTCAILRQLTIFEALHLDFFRLCLNAYSFLFP